MSEELTGTQEAQIPGAEVAASEAAVNQNANGEAPDAPAADTAEQPAEQKVDEQPKNDQPGETAAPGEGESAAAEQTPQPKKEEPPIVIDEELINKAIEEIKANGKCGCTYLRHHLKIPFKKCVALLDKLTEMGILGPQISTYPRKILIERPVKPKPNKTAAKITVSKPPMSDDDRRKQMEANLRKIGGYTDEAFIAATSKYAIEHPGFSKRCRWGNTLIVMVNRLAIETLNSLKTFTSEDVDNISIKLCDFNQRIGEVLGDSVEDWNDENRFKNNFAQRDAVKKFFKIDCPVRDMNPKDRCLTAVVQAAWPNKNEEERGTGGTYAERFVYLSLFIIQFANDPEMRNGLFGNSIHDRPTERWFEKLSERTGRTYTPQTRDDSPSWIKDGKCECGHELTKDSRGRTICSSVICPNHYAKSDEGTPESFRNGGGRRPRPDAIPDIDPDKAPQPQKQKKENWKKRRHERNDGDGGEFPQGNRPKKHGPRFRPNENEDETGNEPEETPSGDGSTLVAHAGGDSSSLGSLAGAFDGLKLPVVEKKDELPPPPDEIPVQ